MEGWLILADISGYTRFLTAVELEHGAVILQRVVEGMVEATRAPYHLVEVEGDAVFAYAAVADVATFDQVVDRLEDCYYHFRVRLASMVEGATCTCGACQSAARLDLKFVVHRGRFVLSELAGRAKPLGPDVILAHRLLKNGVRAATGWNAYLLATASTAGDVPAHWRRFVEDAEGMGRTEVVALDLGPRFLAVQAAGRHLVEEADAAFVTRAEVDAAPCITWPALTRREVRSRWDRAWAGGRTVRNEEGRVARGAEIHCEDGPTQMVMRILDWRPFDYFTYSTTAWLGVEVVVTCRLRALPGGRCEVALAVSPRTPGLFADLLVRHVVGPGLAANWRRDAPRLAELLAATSVQAA